MHIPFTWGIESSELLEAYPCDPILPDPDHTYFRGIRIQAPAFTVFRWLCQLKAAPYSYDWIDNFGRPSPPHLIEGLENLEAGQRVMTIFSLVSFRKDEHITIIMKSRRAIALFGLFVVTYRIYRMGPGSCRLVAKLLVRYNPGLNGLVMKAALPWGDLIMMRKQLLIFKSLSEASHRSDGNHRI